MVGHSDEEQAGVAIQANERRTCSQGRKATKFRRTRGIPLSIGSLRLLRQCLAVMFDVPPDILLDPRYVPSVMDMTAGVFVFVSGDDKDRCLK